MALAGRNGDHVGPHDGRDPRRRPHRAARRIEPQDVAVLDLPLGRGLGMQLHPAVPRDLRDGVGQLLQPRFVGAAAVVQGDVRVHEQCHIAAQCRRVGGRLADVGSEPRDARAHIAVDAAVLQRIIPEHVERPAAGFALRQVAPLVLQVILERAVLAGRFDQHVARRHRVEHGLGDGLLQRDDARAGARIAPLLQRMQIGQNQVAGARGLIPVR